MARSTKSKSTRSGGARSKGSAKLGDGVEDAEVVETAQEGSESGGKAADDTGDGASSVEARPEGGDAPVEGTVTGNGSGRAKPGSKGASAAEAQPGAGDETLEGATEEVGPDDGAASKAASAERDSGSSGAARAAHGDDATSAPVAITPAPVPPPPPQQRGALPLILGGIIAAVLGAGALYFSAQRGWIAIGGGAELRASVEAQSEEIAGLRAALDGLSGDLEALKSAEPDLSEVTGAIGDTRGVVETVSKEVADLGAQVAELAARLGEVETQPIPEAELPASVVAAYQTRLEEMQAALDEQFAGMQAAQDDRLAGIEAGLDDRLKEIEAAQNSAAEAEAAAAEAARAAELRAALAELEIALDTGTGYTAALDTLTQVTGQAAPAALADHAEEGIATLEGLQDRFPPAAREALAVSVAPDPEEGAAGRLGAFLRTQLGVRSLEPREGDDPDAVLSRAEAALADGDIARTIELIGTLPEDGQAAFADWKQAAQARLNALEAMNALSAETNN